MRSKMAVCVLDEWKMWKTYPPFLLITVWLADRYVEYVENLSTPFVDKHIRIINNVGIVEKLSTWFVD